MPTVRNVPVSHSGASQPELFHNPTILAKMVHALNTAVTALAGTSIATAAQGSQQHEPAKNIAAPFSPTTASNSTTSTSIQTPPASASVVEHKYHEICHPCHCAGKNASEIAALNSQRQQHG
ncbi:uncharacterized protein THITE_2086360 [Thermothielavioides terrestris NRRL 8126]|uniref:Uncharacterized protein n=1 Tax=Thermothielavioides terrestris (strain ATCC 38088 / NRRL 8126) TaxID=578455 RepID=G2R1D6_THETT|nr:uncharacterized protein THITE_2086360 [Thermothielavioides terrestris NRRL 8126]AEO64871.1 hypothetical protein THITE_2086360 [Thermothielavioides terrestris NRRL 8126]